MSNFEGTFTGAIGRPSHGVAPTAADSAQLFCRADGGASALHTPKANLTATTAPGVGNDNTQGYTAHSFWHDTTAGHLYWCSSAATGAAVWRQLG